MATETNEFVKDVMSAPLGELISSIGRGVADAQAALDKGSMAQTLELYSHTDADQITTMFREMGYQPTFYAIPETEVEAQVTFSISKSGSNTISSNNLISQYGIQVTPVNATNVNSYNMQASGYAKLKFKIVPVPPPSIVNEVRVVPSLIGLKLEKAVEILNSLQLDYTYNGEKLNEKNSSKIINDQIPSEKTVVKVGEVIVLKEDKAK